MMFKTMYMEYGIFSLEAKEVLERMEADIPFVLEYIKRRIETIDQAKTAQDIIDGEATE